MFRTSREGPLEEKAPAGQPAHRVHGGKAMTSLTKKMRLVSVGVAAVLTLGLVGTAAAVTSSRSTSSSSPQAPFHICANPYSVLKIMPKWTCPAGTVAVRLGSTGARGATGATGPTGAGANVYTASTTNFAGSAPSTAWGTTSEYVSLSTSSVSTTNEGDGTAPNNTNVTSSGTLTSATFTFGTTIGTGNSASYKVTLYVNGATSGDACTISGVGSDTCTITPNLAVTAGQYIELTVVRGSSGTSLDTTATTAAAESFGFTQVATPHTVIGSATEGGGGTATVILSGSGVFTSASTYVCTASSSTNTEKDPVDVVRNSGTSFTMHLADGNSGEVLSYICTGD